MPELSEIQKSLVFSVFLSVLWIIAFYLYAKVTGWVTLAKFYKTHSRPSPFTCRFKVILMRYRLSYEWATHLHATPEGLYLAVAFLFRPGHPCLFIPWNEITITHAKHFVLKYAVLTTHKAPHIHIRIPQATFALLEQSARRVSPESVSHPDSH